MTYSTISVSKETKDKLERLRRRMEKEKGKPLTWDEFFEELIREKEIRKDLRLSEEEANLLLKLTEEGRKSWKMRNV